MSKRQKLFAAFLSILATAALVIAFVRDSEPHYRGIALSEWLVIQRSYAFRALTHVVIIDGVSEHPRRDTLGPEAEEAIKQIGTNALPMLIAWMNAPRMSWKVKVAAALQKLPSAVRPVKLPAWLDGSRDLQRASLAAYCGFRVLGVAAAPVAPELARIACDPDTVGSPHAITVLVQMGRPVVPELIGLIATNVTPKIRANAIIGLGAIGPDATESVPAVIGCLKQSDEAIACLAARTLGRIRRQSEIAIPALVKSLG